LVVMVLLFVNKRKKGARPAPQKSAVQPTQVSTSASGKKGRLGKLIGRGKPIQDKTYEIGPQGLKIGRIPDKNDIVIEDEEVSREHAWIGPEGDTMVVMDLNSTNGTFINSVSKGQIQKSKIQPGDFVFIGKAGKISLLYQKG
ncbi:MAG: FHA domain-containing protein, partial [Thermodesulfobacteriota bacterium]